jgi:Xaa-Pro aminopeptidase
MADRITLRLERLRASLVDRGLDAMLVSSPQNRRYLSGFTGSAGYLLVSANSSLIATDFRYFEQARQEAFHFTLYPLKGSGHEWLKDILLDLGVRRIGLEAAHLSQFAYHQFVEVLSRPAVKISVTPVVGMVESLRTIKDDDEMSSIMRSAALAHRGMEHIMSVARPGMAERELAWAAERFLREGGSEPLPFEVIVASGPRSALPHAKPTEKALQVDEPIVVDLGATIDGYSSDITRTFCLGEGDETFRRIRDIVLGAQQIAISTISSGMTGDHADRLGRIVIEEAGYGDAFGHGLGHGVGLEAHEMPRLGPSSADVLQAGMVFTIEPGIYLPGWGGVRMEDTVVMESGGVRVLGRNGIADDMLA